MKTVSGGMCVCMYVRMYVHVCVYVINEIGNELVSFSKVVYSTHVLVCLLCTNEPVGGRSAWESKES